jgi:predicted TIM-barrel fold metal-dependent hydrolase
MIIDVHVHPTFLPPNQSKKPPEPLPQYKGVDILKDPSNINYAARLTSLYYYHREPVELTLEDFISQMNEAKIDKAVLLSGSNHAQARNQALSEIITQYPTKLLGFGGFDVSQGEKAVPDMDYTINTLGFKGFKLVTSSLELKINDKKLYPFYAKAEELGVPVLIHTGSALIMGLRTKYEHPLLIDDVAFDFPELKIICAHMGSYEYMGCLNMLVRHPNVYADLSFWPLHPLYSKMIPWDLLEETVSDKLLLGSDYSAGHTPKEAVYAVSGLPIGQRFKEKILGQNASRLLKL